MTKQLYPSWRFHTSGDTVKFPDRKVNSAAEAEALGPGWTNGDTEVYREAEAAAPVVPPTGPVPAKQLFPSWRYHQDGRSLLVANEAEADALGPEWTNGDAAPAEPTLRQDGPTFEEFVNAGYQAEHYPPHGYAEKASPGLEAYRVRPIPPPVVEPPPAVVEPPVVEASAAASASEAKPSEKTKKK